MHPYLLEIPWGGTLFRLPSYGVFLALAFSAAYFESLRRATKTGEDPRHIENLFLIVVGASVVGARLFHVLFEEPGYYWQNPGKIVALWEGGYTFYGAMLAAVGGIFLYCRTKEIMFLPFGDIAAPAAALGLFIGRTGCFLAGCCWGTPTHLPWAVVYRHADTFSAVKGIPVHPAQLYEAFGALGIFAYLTWRFRDRKYPGQILFHGLAIYAVLRFFVEFVRGDEARGFIASGLISYSQFVSIAILPLAVLGMRYFGKLEAR